MTSTNSLSTQHQALRRPISRFALLVGAAIASAATLGWSRSMGNGPGTMGLGWGEFLGVWAVMMAAIMLPTLWHEIPHPLAAAQQHLLARTIAFVAGYLSVRAATGIAALALATGAEHLAGDESGAATYAAVALFAVCGLYQFSSAKSRALAHCRLKNDSPNSPPEGQAPGAMLGGVAHGSWCCRSSWPAMALLIPFGIMNIPAKVVLPLAIYVERAHFPGRRFSRLIGFALLLLVPLVLLDPGLAPGLHPASMGMPM